MPAPSPTPTWHLLTGEYPPQRGGVSDYTRMLAQALTRAGQQVHVWAPGDTGAHLDGDVTVHAIPGLLTPLGPARLTRELDRCPGPRRLLLQYVPHAFGMKAMNVPFCAWFATRRQDERWVFFHEIVYPWSPRDRLRHQVLAGTTWVMARLLAQGLDRAFVSIPAWTRHLPANVQPLAEWCPIPSTLPVDPAEAAIQQVRTALGPGPWLGHFGTYAPSITGILEAVLVPLLRAERQRKVLLLGRTSREFAQALVSRHPDLTERVVARGALPGGDVAAHLAAVDLLVQPYPDGVTSRRTTVMAGLSLGCPLVTNTGHHTEPLWRELDAVALVEGTATAPLVQAAERLLSNPTERLQLGERAARAYREHFALERTVERLLRPGPSSREPRS
ncbi:glycosyltransferase family 4 protein [Myxococcus sp. CA039A]|uniref:glycosyltransferase family 4 protein n=1 Tax=Myxococcus sp. CA039A TaxID=2741737 RepID=UPI00157AF6B3|nr:glycosyltransferase family 4 protein [Myxococcus sp. CA039A]NTX57878.1 glycosyltransferase family 4 protein [Myxococcus sp. CA039A]